MHTQKQLNILVVEDLEQYAISALGLFLGHKVTYSNHQKAGQLLEKQQFDLVLTDRITYPLLPDRQFKPIFGLVAIGSWEGG